MGEQYGDVFLWGDDKKNYRQGQKVRFTAIVGPEGKPIAKNLTSGLKGGGPSKEGSNDQNLGDFIGTIKSFVFKKNHGFIECDDLAEYGDVFLWGDEIKQYKQGQKVRFSAILNGDGQPVAKNLRSGLKEQSGDYLGEFSGTIKSFVFKSNYGFIDCPDLAEHGEIFLWGDERKNYKVGHHVKFTAVLKDGKAQAKSLKSGLK